jgi:hypothetical protein
MSTAEWAGVAAAVPATAHSLWLAAKVRRDAKRAVSSREDLLNRQIDAQRQHALQLWPRPWQGGRPLTQVEEIAEEGKGWLGDPLDPDVQLQQLKDDAQRLLDSYRPKDAT